MEVEKHDKSAGDEDYKDVSTSAEIEQEAGQENNCELSDMLPLFSNNIDDNQVQTASIYASIGGGNGSYEDVSTSAEIEQIAEQENNDCDGSICKNVINAQSQTGSISTAIGGPDGS